MWLSLVERCVRDAEAAGSNPVISTIGQKTDVFTLYYVKKPQYASALLRFLFLVFGKKYFVFKY